jgi:hypothetical protein
MGDDDPAIVLVTLPMTVNMARDLHAELGRELDKYDREAAADAERSG